MKIKSVNGVWKNVALGILVVCALFTSLISYKFYESYTKSNRFKFLDSINCIIDMKYNRMYHYDGKASFKLFVDNGEKVQDNTVFFLKDIWSYER